MDDHDVTTRAELTTTVVVTDEGHATVVLLGRFDAVEAMTVRGRFAAADIADVRHLVVDLSGVDFIDSAGLAVLARAKRDRDLAGGTFTLVRPTADAAMRVFRLTQFDQIFAMVDSQDAEASP